MADEGISSIIELVSTYQDEDECVKKLYELKTANGWTCPKCGAPAPSLLLKRRKIQCQKCSHQEAVTRGTAMYRSHIPLQKWFVAIYLVANDKRGVSAWSLCRELQVKWESAYYLLQRVRGMMAESGCLQQALGDAGAR